MYCDSQKIFNFLVQLPKALIDLVVNQVVFIQLYIYFENTMPIRKILILRKLRSTGATTRLEICTD